MEAQAARRNQSKEEPRLTLTDLGNAERFADEHGRDVRFCYPMKQFFYWDGSRWRPDDSGVVEAKMKRTVRGIYGEAERAEDSSERKALADHAKRSESQPKIMAALSLARSEPGIPVAPSELDANPWLLNVSNGTIDLRTGELREHRRSDLITKISPVEYDPDVAAPTFERFLERILPPEGLRGFVRRVVGYAASGDVSEEILTIAHGTGANGKSTLFNAIMDAFGEYATQAAPDLLLAKRGSHPTELADLFGARFVASVETDEGRRLAESLVKQLTGRDPIKARRMREDFWQFAPTHTLFLATNHRPEIRGTDRAIWRRIRLVPFEETIPEAEQDKHLAEKLRAELPGILAWVVDGCLEYQRVGLGTPEEVTTATEGYRGDMDVLAAFVADRCVEHPRATAGATPLYNAYREWCEANGEPPIKQTRFGLQLRERGFTDGRDPSTRRKLWEGIGLFVDDEPPPGNPPKQFDAAKQSETGFEHEQLVNASRGRNAQNGLRTVSEAPTVSQTNGDKRHSQGGHGQGEGQAVKVRGGESQPDDLLLSSGEANREDTGEAENGVCPDDHGLAEDRIRSELEVFALWDERNS